MSQESKLLFEAGLFQGPVHPGTEVKSGSGALGALSTSKKTTVVVTTGVATATLPNGSFVGQEKLIHLQTDGGTLTVTPTTLVGGTTIALDDAGDYANLIWLSTGWATVGSTATIA
jgi:hypothetical protein